MRFFSPSLICILLLLTSLQTAAARHGAKTGPDVKLVDVVSVSKGQIKQTVRLLGTFQAKQTTEMYAKRAGVVRILVAPGQTVQRGTLLATIESPSVKQDKHLTNENVLIAKNQYERVRSLLSKGYVSEKEVDDKKQAWIDAKIAWERANSDLEETRFVAPFTGIISSLKKSNGAQVLAGEPILTLHNPSDLTVAFNVPCTNIQGVHVGMNVLIQQKQYPITEMQNSVDELSHMCPAKVRVDCPNCLLGSSVNVDVILAEKQNTLVIPNQAILLNDGKSSVYVVEKNQIVVKPVTLGVQEQEKIEILAGIEENAQLITQGIERLSPGMPVKVNKKLS